MEDRDYFAGHSGLTLNDLIVVYKVTEKEEPHTLRELTDDLAKMHYVYADSMIKARKNEN